MGKEFTPQQAYPGYPGVRPPKGWVPPLDVVLKLLGVYDTQNGVWVGLPLQALIEGLVQAEQLNSLGKVDTRQSATLTVPSGTGVGVYATRKSIVVPDNEIWFITQMVLTTPAQNVGIVLGNVRVSTWPDTATTPDADGLPFWAANRGQAAGGVYTAECHVYAPVSAALGDAIGAPLRLPPNAKLTICSEVTVGALGADLVVTLDIYGSKGKLLAPLA